MTKLERLQALEREWHKAPPSGNRAYARDRFYDAVRDAAPDLIRVALAAMDAKPYTKDETRAAVFASPGGHVYTAYSIPTDRMVRLQLALAPLLESETE